VIVQYPRIRTRDRKLVLDRSLGPRDAEGYATVTREGSKMSVRNDCLPDTVDPHGPKGR